MGKQIVWRTSSHSTFEGNCVEFAGRDNGSYAVRDSKNPTGPVLMFPAAAWSAFTAGARAGEFD